MGVVATSRGTTNSAPNNALDRSGGCAFVKGRGPSNLALTRAASSTQTLGVFSYDHCQSRFHNVNDLSHCVQNNRALRYERTFNSIDFYAIEVLSQRESTS